MRRPVSGRDAVRSQVIDALEAQTDKRRPAMKKTSTAATRSDKNLHGKLTIGLDLGDRSSWFCVLDEAGEVVSEKNLGTTPKAMKEVFAAMPRSRIALETGMHSPWVSRLLSELGHEVIVAHARNVRLIGESRRKDDRFDAMTLGQRDQRAHALDLLQQCRLRITLLRDSFDLLVVLGDALTQRFQGLQQRTQRRLQFRTQALSFFHIHIAW